ncbi:hypothetical protein A6U89_29745 [Agrobacterium sp. B133/95]|nr:hypothetical protein A6U89_29745 [Agrobacterium sp. B133/95]
MTLAELIDECRANLIDESVQVRRSWEEMFICKPLIRGFCRSVLHLAGCEPAHRRWLYEALERNPCPTVVEGYEHEPRFLA